MQDYANHVCGCSIKKALKVAGIGYWEWDITSHTLFWSQELYEIYGFNQESQKASKDALYTIVNQRDRERVVQTIEACFQNNTPYSMIYRILKPNGFQSHIRETCEVLYNSSGLPIKITGIVENTTKNNFYECHFNGYHAIFQMIFNNIELKDILETIICNYESYFPGIKCSVLLLDEKAKHLRLGAAPSMEESYNQAIQGMELEAGSCGLAAYIKEMVIVEEIADDPLWGKFKGLALEHGLRACWSIPIYSSKGKILGIFAIYYAKPTRPSGKELYIIEAASILAGLAIEHHQTIQDHHQRQAGLEQIIQQRTYEIEKQYRYIRKAKADIEAGLRAKSEFLSNVSHELRTPLNAIMGFSDLLNESYYGDLNEKQQEFVGHIQMSSRNLLDIVNNVLGISKIESENHPIKREQIDIPHLINFCLTYIKEKAIKHNIKFWTEIPPEFYEEKYGSDLSVLKTVLMNLIGNAVKFTPDGGQVMITVSREESRLLFKIADTGVGIAKELQEMIFESFYQVNNSLNEKSCGVGLGLTMSKKMIEMLGGRIWVESEGNSQGSSFYFTVPIQ